jgi:hypothetical protein
MAMGPIVLLGGLTFSILVAVYGLLMARDPIAFLRLHDFLKPGSRWNTSANGRRELGASEYRSLGWILFLSGLFFTFVTVRKLLGFG